MSQPTELTPRGGARIALINRGETPSDDAAALRVWAGIAEAQPPAVELLRRAPA